MHEEVILDYQSAFSTRMYFSQTLLSEEMRYDTTVPLSLYLRYAQQKSWTSLVSSSCIFHSLQPHANTISIFW